MRSGKTLIAFVFSVAVPQLLLAAESPDFNRQVLPVFRKYCVGCHNTKEAEAGLILQDFERSIKGSDESVVIVAGKSHESRLWKRLTAQDQSQMPPKGKPAPKPEELALIRNWIDAGAKPPTGGAGSSGLITPKIEPRKQVREAITSVAFSPDGKWTVLARPHRVEVVSSAGSKELSGHKGAINNVSFSRTSEWLCVAAGETALIGEATLWRTSDWTRGPVFSGHADALYSAELSPDGGILATASYDRELITWNVATGQQINRFLGHNDAIYSSGFSPDGKLIATASGDRTVKLWNVASGRRLDTLSQPAKDQTTVSFSPDGRHVAAGGVDARIRIWQISENGDEGTNPILYTRFAHEGPILKIVYSPDGKLLASSSEDLRIKLWETKTYTQVAVLDRQSDWVSGLSFSPDNRHLLVGRMNGEHQIYAVDPAWTTPTSKPQGIDVTSATQDNASSAVIPFIAEIEPNNQFEQATVLSTPGTAKGELRSVNAVEADVDFYRFTAKAGDCFVIETRAERDGSLADTRLDVLNSDGSPILRTVLQAVRDSWINFRPIDSSSPDVRLEFWEEMDLNQLVYMNGEVCKTFRAPQGPDSGYVLYASNGKRRDYFDTSATGHAKDEPAYIVEAFPPDSKIVENGLPVFPLYYTNDDDSDRRLGKDSRLTFTAPADGSYLIKVSDVRGASGDKYSYTVTVRPPRPDFSVAVNTMNPKIPAGSGQRLKFTLTRIDNFEGPVRLDIAGLPAGFEASSPVVIEAGLFETTSVLTATNTAPEPTAADWERITILATAEIGGQLVTRRIGGLGELKLEKPAPFRVSLVPDDPNSTSPDHGLVIEPGTTITAKIVVERDANDHDDIRFDVDNLPHGIIVDNIGLSGVLIRKQESERQIFLTARPWVPETDRLIHAVAQRSGNPASSAIRLSVRKGRSMAAK